MNQEDKIKIWIEEYLNISQDYARTCSMIADNLDRIGSGNARLMEELASAARESKRLAEEISKVMKLAQDTPSDSWLESNFVSYINFFIELSHRYSELRDGFIDSLTDSESPVPRIIPGDGKTEKVSKRDREDKIIKYMNEKRTHYGKRQWSNQAIGDLFGIKPNSVVNRLYAKKAEPPTNQKSSKD